MTPKEVIAFCRENTVGAIDLRFTDFLGRWAHTTIPVSVFDESVFEKGVGFDGSSVHGWQRINESDMLLLPQADTCFLDPFTDLPTLSILCNVVDPITLEEYSRDPRFIARKAATWLKSSGIADTANFGPEVEFFIFDSVRFDQTQNSAFFFVDSGEGPWNRGAENVSGSGGASSGGANLGYRPGYQRGYLACPPTDQLMNLRNAMMQTLIDCGIEAECQHHEVGSAGQAEIDFRFSDIVSAADNVMAYKYLVRNTAWRHGKSVTFMPKPLFDEAGSGMHTHFSLWKEGQPLFAGEAHAGLSKMAMYAMGGILTHAPALLAITNPTTNSYRRLVPGFEAPDKLAWSQRNRSAACRIPVYSNDPATKRIEFRCPDATCNPYLAFAAILMAAVDGIENKIDPGSALDKDIYDLPPEELTDVPGMPATLDQALSALEHDHEFLLRGDVFTRDVVKFWIHSKRTHDVESIRARPHPFEFCMYYDL